MSCPIKTVYYKDNLSIGEYILPKTGVPVPKLYLHTQHQASPSIPEQE